MCPLLLATISLDAQIGTPYPRSAGFETDNGAVVDGKLELGEAQRGFSMDDGGVGFTGEKARRGGVGVKTGGSWVGGLELCV